MKRQFLVASDDEPVSAWEPVIVLAGDKEEAIDRYLRAEYSKDAIFRESVLNLTINCSFVEKFFIVSPEDKHNFDATGQVEYDLRVVQSRVMAFFADRPDLGERFVRYMDTRNVSYINAEVFEFISAADASGIIALDLGEIRQL